MPKRFISAAIQPEAGSFDATRMATGEPGLPDSFRWEGRAFRIARVVRTWRESGPCDHVSSDRYVRRHGFEVMTDDGACMTLYFERHPRRGEIRRRWWLYSIDEPEGRG